MPTIADYVVLTDAPFTLPSDTPPTDQHLRFDAPRVNKSTRSILTFMANPDISSGNVTLRMRLNNAAPLNLEFGTDPTRAWHEVFPAGTLNATGNELTVSVPGTSGGGSIQVSDIVIFFQADVGPVVSG